MPPTYSDLWLAHALVYRERFGFSVIPMAENKRPKAPWAEFQEHKPTVREILGWPRESLAIVTGAVSGIAVIDCDSEASARWFGTHRLNGATRKPALVQTRRGYHLFFRHPGERVMNGSNIEGKYDVRGDGGYVIAPPSKHSEGNYRWIRPIKSVAELPRFDPRWRPVSRQTDGRSEQRIRDGVAYIAKIKAVSGQGGHNDTYRAACALQSAGLRESEALVALQQWNRTNAEPPWSDRELLHKVRSAFDNNHGGTVA